MLGRGCFWLEQYVVKVPAGQLLQVKLLNIRNLLFSLENLIVGFRWRFSLYPPKEVVPSSMVSVRQRRSCCS
jgi:hypothetical protein